jgi:hypothetical protein
LLFSFSFGSLSAGSSSFAGSSSAVFLGLIFLSVGSSSSKTSSDSVIIASATFGVLVYLAKHDARGWRKTH